MVNICTKTLFQLCSQNIREGIFLTNGLYDLAVFSYFEFIWKICVQCNLVFIFHYVGILVSLCERVLCFVSGLVRKFPISTHCTKLSEFPRENLFICDVFANSLFSGATLSKSLHLCLLLLWICGTIAPFRKGLFHLLVLANITLRWYFIVA